MKRVRRVIRKVAIALVGFPVLGLGVVLIPLPGPGVPVCLLGLIILSFEFEWAARWRSRIQQRLKAVWDTAQARANRVRTQADPLQDDESS